MISGTVVVIDYTNHRGDRRERTIIPSSLQFVNVEWHEGHQWILDATDLGTGAMRSFAMRDIHSWRPADEVTP